MTCEKWEPKLWELLDGELTETEIAEVRKHLAECPACSTQLERLRGQERLLGTYYQSIVKPALDSPKPSLASAQKSRAGRATRHIATTYQWYAAAAMLAIMILGGIPFYLYHHATASRSGEEIATVSRVVGRVQYFDEGKLQDLRRGMKINSGVRFKTTADSYLAVELAPKPGETKQNLIEFKDNSMAEFRSFADRNVLWLERGEVWVHLNDKPQKELQVETKQFVIHDVGTVFNVARGMTGTSVGVASGMVEAKSSHESKEVSKREFFASFDESGGDNVWRHVYWSYERDRLLAMLGPEPGREGVAVAQSNEITPAPPQQLRVPKYEPPARVVRAAPTESLGTLSTTQLMPTDTRFLFDMADLPDAVHDFQNSAYGGLLKDPALQAWWNMPQMSKVRETVETKLGLPSWLHLLATVSGGASFSIPPINSRGFVFVGDCRNSFDETRTVLESEIFPMLAQWKERNRVSDSGVPTVVLKRGYLVVAAGERNIRNTLKAIEDDQPTTFTQSRFYQRLSENVPSSRLTVAFDFHATMKSFRAKGDARFNKFLDRSGFGGLDYILGSPDFSGRGTNQAFRVGFVGPRQGAMSWLDAPAAMGSLKFFGPDTHILLAARIKRPQVMFDDVVQWIVEDEGGTWRGENSPEFFLVHELASCFGNEFAIGLANPVLPIPNVTVAIEVIEPFKVHDLLLDVIDAINLHDKSTTLKVVSEEYRGHLIMTLLSKDWHFPISYVLLDDYLIFGPGDAFVRHTVDIYHEQHSILDESGFQALLPETGRINFSALLYQDITRVAPELLNHVTKNWNDRERAYLPKIDLLDKYRAAGLSYAISTEDHVDFYVKGSLGVDFNLGGAMPLIATFLMPKVLQQDRESRLDTVTWAIFATGSALEAYNVDNKGRYPDTLSDLVSPVRYLEEVPKDPYASAVNAEIQYSVTSDRDSYVLYSVGLDGRDNMGVIAYDPTNGVISAGDLIRKSPQRQ
ncbi:MAG: zf-HC2 domain-containing protein [bacterium]